MLPALLHVTPSSLMRVFGTLPQRVLTVDGDSVRVIAEHKGVDGILNGFEATDLLLVIR